VYADLVLNHNSGADAQEQNPITGEAAWTGFSPKSGRFMRDWTCFHPSDYESWDDGTFGAMPDLCHRNPKVYGELMEHAKWLVESIGFDGFRYDMVKGYGGWLVTAIQEYRYNREGGRYRKPFGVVEHWSGYDEIMEYLNGVNYFSDNAVSAFDFPLRYRLKALCGTYGFSLKELTYGGTILAARPSWSVTFVENHDTRDDPIVNEKMLAYAYILTHEGYPCVFWQDYYSFGLAEPGSRSGIDALVAAHGQYAHGGTDILYADDGLYIMQRRGLSGAGGLVFVLNNHGQEWRGNPVQTTFPSARFRAVAFRGRHDASNPEDECTNEDGWGDFWAPPRGYSVYAREL
jgi:alpha-amylase